MADQPEINMDHNGLYREEIISDRKVGTIIKLVPINAEGEDDSSRETIYQGQTQMMTQAGPLPLNFEIQAANLKEAAEGFGAAAQKAADETLEKLREMQREQASSIVVPGQGGAPGGMPGGGIQL